MAAHDPVMDALAAQDEALRRRDLVVWIGAEPTFTRREAQDPWWLSRAEGGDKEAYAQRLLRALAPRLDAPAVLARVVGRHFPDEDAPRFAYEARWRRGDTRPAPSEAPPIRALEGPSAPGSLAGPEHARLTVTPDPGVVEVNMAPARSATEFLRFARQVYAAAAEAGLSPVRFRYNGQATDSGGGGQLTFGGPTPERSPFFTHPRLLPGLLRYLHAHPALSYAFGSECLGSASQGPRPDEGVRERFDELCATLDHVARAPMRRTGAELRGWLWETFAPLLVDASGNSHRAEVNIEKLWNPHYPKRGELGLVELRALRMQPTPEDQAAVAALFRAVVARAALAPDAGILRPWGEALHDRFALPRFLDEDLRAVLADLDAHGLGLDEALASRLFQTPPPVAEVDLNGATLRLTPALEFWPLVGDVASQERAGARLVDSSTRRLQIEVTAPGGDDPGLVHVGPRPVPLTRVAAGVHLAGLRYRAFVPNPGFLLDVAPHDPLVLTWRRGAARVDVTLHGWRPDGGAYVGLPADAAEAAARRRDRVVVSRCDAIGPTPTTAATHLTTDLRRPAPEPS